MSRRVGNAAWSALALVATAAVVVVGRADAPPAQAARFGRVVTTTCISDQWTKLTWARTPASAATLGAAEDACAQIAPDAGAGGGVWRVPSVNELETLVDDVPHFEIDGTQNVPKAIDANAFPSTPVDGAYWTASLLPGAAYTWVVYFNDGSTTRVSVGSGASYVRCVADVLPGGAPPACPSSSN